MMAMLDENPIKNAFQSLRNRVKMKQYLPIQLIAVHGGQPTIIDRLDNIGEPKIVNNRNIKHPKTNGRVIKHVINRTAWSFARTI